MLFFNYDHITLYPYSPPVHLTTTFSYSSSFDYIIDEVELFLLL